MKNSFFCTDISEKEMINEFLKVSASNKSTLENFKPSVLVSVLDIIVKPLTFLFNLSLQSGIFPDKLKIARVIPVPKKGDITDCSNYRPISLLSIFDKLFEKIVYSKLIKYLDKFNILFKHQYGFRSNHSTTFALCEITDYIYKSLD